MKMELTHGELRHLRIALDDRIDTVRNRMLDNRSFPSAVQRCEQLDAELKTLRLRVTEAIRAIYEAP